MLGWRWLMAALLMAAPACLAAQTTPPDSIRGTIRYPAFADTAALPAAGATVYWAAFPDTATLTDAEGRFALPMPPAMALPTALSIQVPGFPVQDVTVLPADPNASLPMGLPRPRFRPAEPVAFVLPATTNLDTTTIEGKHWAQRLDRLAPQHMEVLDKQTFERAACCNLAESFETVGSVDARTMDAVTGLKTIQLLGLAGPYTQVLTNGRPHIRGINRLFGLQYLPGLWAEEVSVVKGTGSVANGWEAIAGQVNLCLTQPDLAPPLQLNLFLNHMSRMEANLTTSRKLGKGWSGLAMGHASGVPLSHDSNRDGFLDMPKRATYTGLLEARYDGQQGQSPWRARLGTQVVDEDRIAGQTYYDPDDSTTHNRYGVGLKTRRVEGWGNLGYVFGRPRTSIGLQTVAYRHSLDATLGPRRYTVTEDQLWANLMGETYLGNTNHILRGGLSFLYNRFDQGFEAIPLSRTEYVPGGYVEYNGTFGPSLSLVAGLRLDHHNLYGTWFTPRLHLRWTAVPQWLTLRLHAGRGRRVANPVADYLGLFITSRAPNLLEPLNEEDALISGASLSSNFTLAGRPASLVVDYHYSYFLNQVMPDLEHSPDFILLHNAEGADAHTLQAEAKWEVLRRLELNLVYKYYRITQTHFGHEVSAPFVPRHRGLITARYTVGRWGFDVTTAIYGPARLPNADYLPEDLGVPEQSPTYAVVNLNVRHTFSEQFAVYLGVENLTNTTQSRPIIGAEDPFGPNFDASRVWGPIMGSIAYVGLTWTPNLASKAASAPKPGADPQAGHH